jgi:hypothetical protein
MTMTSRLRLVPPLVLAGLLSVGAAGCSPSEGTLDGPEPTVSYTPVPDDELFADVAELPGVSQVDLEFDDSSTGGYGYVGDLRLEPGGDPVQALDRVIAILRQGRPEAAMTIEVRQPDRTTTTVDLPMRSATEPYLTDRYGPQPGDGSPPPDAG